MKLLLFYFLTLEFFISYYGNFYCHPVTHPVTVEAKIVIAQYSLKSYKSFCASYLLMHFALILQFLVSSISLI